MLLPSPTVTTKHVARHQPGQQQTRAEISTLRLQRALRYPALLSENWQTVTPTIQQRFLKSADHRGVTIYQGRIQKTHLSTAGALLSRLCRLIGSPLPHANDVKGPATVIVREAKEFNGQYWTRIYPSRNQFPHVIQSIKKFGGPTGLEEQISNRLGVALTLKPGTKSLSFISDHYYLKAGRRRIKIPAIFSPGRLTVCHRETGPKRFRYTMSLHHKWFGELIYQTAIFEELTP